MNDVIVVGNSHDRVTTQAKNIPGHIRGYDAKTGRLLWRFNVLPQEGEFGNDTWETDAYRYTGNISAWAPLSTDSDLGLVYIPTDTPTNDYYGGDRPGGNLFGTSLIALDAKTGQRVWHFQMVHHDVWNLTIRTLPNCSMSRSTAKPSLPLWSQPSRVSYVFNRATGEPIWPIEEREVAASSLPASSQQNSTFCHPSATL